MSPPRPDDGKPAPKLLASVAVRLRLAAVSGAILLLGVLLAPRTLQMSASTAEERAAPLLEEQVQTREPAARPMLGPEALARVLGHAVSIANASTTWRTSTDFSAPHPGSSAAGFGVLVSGAFVLTHIAALDGRSGASLSTSAGRSIEATVVAYERGTGLVLLRSARSDLPPAPTSTVRPEPGTPAAAIGIDGGRPVVQPIFVTSVVANGYTVSPGAGLRPGMPLFTIDGALFAVAGDSGHGQAFAAEAAVARLTALAAGAGERSSFGLGFQPLADGDDSPAASGVLINEVVPGGPAAVAGVAPGDVLLAVDGIATPTVDEAARALGGRQPGSPSALRIRREARLLDLTATPASTYDVAAVARGRDGDGLAAPQARQLFSDDVLARAALPPGALVLSVNGRPVSGRADVERIIRRARGPLLLLLREDGRQFITTIESAP